MQDVTCQLLSMGARGLYAETLSSAPVAQSITPKEEAPLEINGSVIPVEGKTFVATPILINACSTISEVIPAARYAP